MLRKRFHTASVPSLGEKICSSQTLETLSFCIFPQSRSPSKWTKKVVTYFWGRRKYNATSWYTEHNTSFCQKNKQTPNQQPTNNNKKNPPCTAKPLCSTRGKYIPTWRCRPEAKFSFFVYKQTVTPVFQRLTTNTQTSFVTNEIMETMVL